MEQNTLRMFDRVFGALSAIAAHSAFAGESLDGGPALER
jgi:hypothetical protein